MVVESMDDIFEIGEEAFKNSVPAKFADRAAKNIVSVGSPLYQQIEENNSKRTEAIGKYWYRPL
jgi:hypothetical protein